MLKKIVHLAFAATLCSTQAFAAMPLITDDTGTQGKGITQLEFGWQAFRKNTVTGAVTAKESGGGSSTTLSYGLSDNIDLVAAIPWSWSRVVADGTTTSDEHGIGDLALQFKWRLVEIEEGRFSLAMKPCISLPTGNENKPFGNGRISGGLQLIATHAGALGSVHLNLGYTRNDYSRQEVSIASRQDIWNSSIAGQINLSGTIQGVADIGIQTNRDKSSGTSPAYLLGGLVFTPSGRLGLDVGVKRGLNDAEPDTALLAGITLHF